ncbi:MAG: class I SAM-dependent methyltransferase [Clostridia bacterium]|nr:class I SAM-dependent methyltransferase [Clostridia bacterium]
MEDWLKQVKDGWNETADSDWYRSLRTEERLGALVRDPASAFHPAVFSLIGKYLPDLKGKKVLLPSSGDNHAAFAFALLGARVTSSDISERQLENAAAAAEKLGLEIRFVCDNTMELSRIESGAFDLVYTSNGTHSWIPDLGVMYRNISRVLRSGGFSVMYDVHPFNRPFTGEPWKEPRIVKAYSDTLPSCHWRVQDLVNANLSVGLALKEMAELAAVSASFWYSYDELVRQDGEKLKNINDWQSNPMAALPAWISIVSQKPSL